MSIFAWLDSSEGDRRRTLDIIDLFQQKETVDELGIGSIRDAIADALSPGTSTIQTRARYFFFIPWIYGAIEGSGNRSDAGERARRAESALIPHLLESGDSGGAIGRLAGASLKRLPSSVYWAGLGRLGFRLFTGSRDRYHRAVKRGCKAVAKDHANDLGVGPCGSWHPHIPKPPKDFPRAISFKLTSQEAKFFLDRLDHHASDSLLHFLVRGQRSVDGIDKPWLHPKLDEMPATLRSWMHDAMCYSELMHGAQLLYNLMLAEKRGHARWLDRYRERFSEWAVAADARRAIYRDWHQMDFWKRVRAVNPRLPAAAEQFSRAWISHVLNAIHGSELTMNAEARAQIEIRERSLKGTRSRLNSQPHLDVWGGESGAAALDYRWHITRTIANDIVEGLGR